MSPDQAYTAGVAAACILTCPIKGDGLAARRWVDGWYDGFLLRRDGIFALV